MLIFISENVQVEKKRVLKKPIKLLVYVFFYLVIQVYDPDKISSIRILKIQTLKRLIYFYLLEF